ncbi:MAG: 50S ribosomal protein L17 [Candidatus Staskawiczbacteria bacterium CG10_big_fil_rev_8_21_14_0_10_38_10]|uniref:50S ribosomal protein L17 n=1 Tax=Candidatus Staskawiczbacteria bacterium CG10_big_fil_rev_8_21_14_0_10_38_10 TaxID=1974891 RepID=A0A2H9T1L3_9BACT|nr:MAG: 50S ribosomal protein L17 [Candidatus Staskawiczbacteria bacterium CG10_big_fil_rev_8_21_14_0_10_38_10]
MRKLKKGRKFHREKAQREALFKALLTSFFIKERIKTTEAKAKEISVIAQKMISRAKKGGLSSQRLLNRNLSREAAKKLVKEIGPKYKERKGGYVRIIKLGQRKSDSAEMAIIELVK